MNVIDDYLLPVFFGCLLGCGSAMAADASGRDLWWWDDAWWEQGRMPIPANHDVEVKWIEYANADVSVPAMIAYPADGRRYPAVLYQHGRRGLDELIQAAGRGAVKEVVLGMAHRGRLNVLANILQKPYATIFNEFEDNIRPDRVGGEAAAPAQRAHFSRDPKGSASRIVPQ